jgi:2-oxoacid dehydrogenases acyltransferase (catalytic domain)
MTVFLLTHPLLLYSSNSHLFITQDLGANVSVNDIVIKSAALALRDVPEANAKWNRKTGRLLVCNPSKIRRFGSSSISTSTF